MAVEPQKPAIVLEDVLFEFDKSNLNAAGREAVERLLDVLNQNPLSKFNIVGHTDNRGSNDYNRQLSLRRAQTVMESLAAAGIEAERMSADGKGAAQPLNNNTSDSERKRNRRVEIFVSGQ
jgi:outer membrane protein OmpA-like peptidoglycan-associated protein